METVKGSNNGPSTNGFAYRFDLYEIDAANRTLLRGGVDVPLTAKVFDLLLVFAQNPGRLLEKDDLMDKIWSQSFVEEGNLARHVSMLRKALGDDGRTHKYIATVPGHGYRFLPEVFKAECVQAGNQNGEAGVAASRHTYVAPIAVEEKPETSRRWVLVIAAGLLLLTAAWFGTRRFFTPVSQIKTLAVLPLRPIDAGDNYLGIGIADAVIRKVSQSHQLTVRPTSAILRYANENSDALTAAKELNTDAVLDGTVQRSGGRLRVSVNLIRSADGGSLWAENFDMPETDIFAVQDKVAQQVTSRLRLHLDTDQHAIAGKYPANPVAYELYIKGLFSLGERGFQDSMPQMAATIDIFKRSIEADPNYAPAHAQLAFAYAWTATQIEATVPSWADLARQEIARARELDPNLAETHLADSILLASAYGDYQVEAAAREALMARQLDPTASHGELAAMYGHLGLDDLASAALQHDLEVDPTSQNLELLTILLPFWRADADAFYAAGERSRTTQYASPWYYMRKGRLDDAQHSLDERLPRNSRDFSLLMQEALLQALKGRADDAEQRAQQIIAMNRPPERSHHTTYDAACIYALDGKSVEAVRWLRETANTGFPNYPLFARDPFLDRIRQTPEFIQFLSEQNAQYERFQHEFAEQ